MTGLEHVFISIPELARFDYGPSHPFRLERLSLAEKLISAYGLLAPDKARICQPPPATEKDLLDFHHDIYISHLRHADDGHHHYGDEFFGLGDGDNPIFPGVFGYSLAYAGGSLAAAEAVIRGSSNAFNMAGGLHHAMPGRASGFCYVNDCVLAILRLLRKYRRVLYLDIDAHHGDGVEAAFADSNRVLTVSFHESGRFLFPGTGFETDMGKGEGLGFAVNVPLLPGSADDIYLECFDELMPPIFERFKPDAIVVQCGADMLKDDPLAAMEASNAFFVHVIRFLLARFRPLVVLGGGGYNMDNVARAWTLVWATLVGAEPENKLPNEYRLSRLRHGADNLRDTYGGTITSPAAARQDARRVMKFLISSVLPRMHDRGNIIS